MGSSPGSDSRHKPDKHRIQLCGDTEEQTMQAKVIQQEEVWEVSFHTDLSFYLEGVSKLLQETTDQTESQLCTKLRWKWGEGNGTPLRYSRLENPMDGGAWWAAVHAVAKSRTRLSDFTFTFPFMHQRRKWQPTPMFLPGESQGRGSLLGCRLWGRTEPDMTDKT